MGIGVVDQPAYGRRDAGRGPRELRPRRSARRGPGAGLVGLELTPCGWPWTREKRADGYTDALTAAMLARADGRPGAKVEALAVVGAASRMYANALAVARIEPATSGRRNALAGPAPGHDRGRSSPLSGKRRARPWSRRTPACWPFPATGYADGGDFDPGELALQPSS